MKLQTAFDEFVDKIELRSLSQERIGRAWARLHGFLTDAYQLPASSVLIQGSYANGTAVRPSDSDGEYDIDIVVVGVESGVSAAAAIAALREKLADDADLASRIESDKSGRPCVRLRYAPEPEGFGFHIDVVPARPLLPFPPHDFAYPKDEPPLEVPMRGQEQWRGTAPLEYIQFCLDRGERFRRTVRELKRWRDVHDAEIKSIVLQVLVAECHPIQANGDAEAIVETLRGIRSRLQYLSEPPEIPNPVLPDENLADRWDAGEFRQFSRHLADAAALAERAYLSIDERESHELWRLLLGDDFPPYTDRSASVPPSPPPGFRSAPQRAPSRKVEWG